MPIENTLGKENDGLKVILSKCAALRLARLTCSFNHERLVMATGSCRAAREIVEQCFKCVPGRRPRLMAQVVEPAQGFRQAPHRPARHPPAPRRDASARRGRAELAREHVRPPIAQPPADPRSVFQMVNMPSYAEQSDKLAGALRDVTASTDSRAGQISLLKSFCTRNAGKIADKAVQIFGGRGITRGGLGRGTSPAADRRSALTLSQTSRCALMQY